MKKLLFILSVTAMALTMPNLAQASIIYNTLGSGNPSYQTNYAWTLGTIGNDYEISEGNAFTPSANYQLTGVEVALDYIWGTNSMDLELMNSTGTGQPGSVLETFSLTNLGPAGQNNPVLTAGSTLNIDLLKGEQYWLFAVPTNPTTFAGWNMSFSSYGNIVDDDHSYGDDNTVQPNNLQGAFQIDGTPIPISAVPEPATMLLFGTGLAGIFLSKRKA